MSATLSGPLERGALARHVAAAMPGRRIDLPENSLVAGPDDSRRFFYFIWHGEVRTYLHRDGEQHLLEILGAGEWFSPVAFARDFGGRVTAVAQSSASVQRIEAGDLLESLRHNPDAALDLLGDLADRAAEARCAALDLIYEDCNQRLLKTLLRFSTSAAARQREDAVTLRITHDQLAQAVGAARETVSLALTHLRRKNLVQTGRNQLIFNPDALRRFAQHGAAAQHDASIT